MAMDCLCSSRSVPLFTSLRLASQFSHASSFSRTLLCAGNDLVIIIFAEGYFFRLLQVGFAGFRKTLTSHPWAFQQVITKREPPQTGVLELDPAPFKMPARLAIYLDRISHRCRREISDRVARRLHRFTLTQPIISFSRLTTFHRMLPHRRWNPQGVWGSRPPTNLSLGLIGTFVADRSNLRRDDLRDLINSGH